MRASLLALAVVALAAVPAQATPYAGQYDLANTSALGIVGADGANWSLRLVATEGSPAQSRSEQFLYVDLRRCVASICLSKGHWVRPLAAAEVSIAPTVYPTGPLMGHAKVTTMLAGRALVIDLSSDNVEGDGVELFDPSRVNPSVSHTSSAFGSVRIGGMTCRTRQAYLQTIAGVDSVGNDSADPRTPLPAVLPAGFLTGKHAPHC